MKEPLVSIICTTYNHEPHVGRALTSFLMQKTDFEFEIIVAEDCSTDDTRKLCESYVERHPEIRLLTSEHNVGGVENEARAVAAAKGKYLAWCEGDDYWIDPLKLQKQVDFMEAHPEYSVCFTRYVKEVRGERLEVRGERLEVSGEWVEEYEELSMEKAMNVWCTQYLTMLCRKDAYDNTWYKQYKYFRDTHQVYLLMCQGKCAILNFVGGVYCITGDGEHSSKDYFRQQQMTLAVDEELWKVNKDVRWKKLCARVMQDLIDRGCNGDRLLVKGDRRVMLGYAWRLLCMTGGVGKFVKNLKVILR